MPVDPPEVLVLPEPLVMPVPDVVEGLALSPLPPPHALIATAMQAASNPLRTNDVFIL